MGALVDRIDALAESTAFSGVVRFDYADDDPVVRAYGHADRAHAIANSVSTRFSVASATKGLTALAVMTLVERGELTMATTARSLLGDDLPLIDDRVTVEHLLGHRSGIGDYFDENAGWEINDYILPVPVHRLATTEDYLSVLGGFPTAFVANSQFAYCNGGYVVLALLAERATGVAYHDLVAQRVCRPAGMAHTSFLRSDERPGDVAAGYLAVEGIRTNALHLPVRGSGDGGASTTAADVHALWSALFAGRVVSPASLAEMIRPRSEVPEEDARYGLGFWLHESTDAVMLAGYDPGISFRSLHQPSTRITHTVISNTSSGAWPMTKLLDELLGT